jgi:hypothetical protein
MTFLKEAVMKKIFSLIATVGFASAAASTAFAEPVSLTDKQMDGITAGDHRGLISVDVSNNEIVKNVNVGAGVGVAANVLTENSNANANPVVRTFQTIPD